MENIVIAYALAACGAGAIISRDTTRRPWYVVCGLAVCWPITLDFPSTDRW